MAAAGGVHRLPRHIPLKIAMGMMLTGKPITRRGGRSRSGWSTRWCRRRRSSPAAERWAREIAECSPLSIQATKQAALQGLGRPLRRGDHHAVRRRSLRLWASDDAKEGPLAFAQKRKPRWTGR